MFTRMHRTYLRRRRKVEWVGIFLGCMPRKNKEIFINGRIHVLCGIHIKARCMFSRGGRIGCITYFEIREKPKMLRLMLEEMGHKQPATPVHCDNSTAVGIANDAVKKQQSRSMEKQFLDYRPS